MVKATVFCFDCRGKFDIYPEHMKPEQPPENCPHCGAVIPEKAFRKLLDVTMQAEEIEKDLRSAADVQGTTLFSVDWMKYHPSTGLRNRRA